MVDDTTQGKQLEDAKDASTRHFVCAGSCGAVSIDPTSCGTVGCTKNGQEMEECMCEGKVHPVKSSSGGWI
ncbi:hypothetical protein HY844_02690 [Candidatus Berkelbacteria bacterium]|nr:hypothetical protein [Candidatus Berkelbacteria bacterium]